MCGAAQPAGPDAGWSSLEDADVTDVAGVSVGSNCDRLFETPGEQTELVVTLFFYSMFYFFNEQNMIAIQMNVCCFFL